MSWKFPYACDIVRLTAGTVLDDYGNAVSARGTVTTVCDLQQIKRDEPASAGESSVTSWNLYLPLGGTIDTTDVVVVGGTEYEMVGEPWYADTGSTDVNHIEATVVKA